MNFSISRIFASVALAGFIGAATSQAGVQAKFHLPMTAHWGIAVLAPGDYTLSVVNVNSGLKELMVQGEGHTMYLMPMGVDHNRSEGASFIQLVERNGNFFVRDFNSSVSGQTFSFNVPKVKVQREAKTADAKTVVMATN